ncbi:MAG: hypothetical protein ACTFAL_03720 [Candidatus Electronema sp. V4]|uniref:hypothetical protein n=1 Tax=Candidatus Electronema sp. V4 TaxID=3454756 RepID=UPI00405572F0
MTTGICQQQDMRRQESIPYPSLQLSVFSGQGTSSCRCNVRRCLLLAFNRLFCGINEDNFKFHAVGLKHSFAGQIKFFWLDQRIFNLLNRPAHSRLADATDKTNMKFSTVFTPIRC